MLDKIKSALLYILAPILILGFVIYHLIAKTNYLEQELESKDSEGKLNELKNKQTDIDRVAGDALTKYRNLRSAYLRGNASSVRPSSSGAGEANSDSGSGDGASADYAKSADPRDKES